jgi:threonine aldolase
MSAQEQDKSAARMNFTSDNAYGAAPEILEALAEANTGAATSYGEDEITAAVQRRFSEVFERDVAVYPVLTGTAANGLALSTLAPPYGAIFCHEESHIAVDECGAPEFFSGGARLVSLPAASGKITPQIIKSMLPLYRRGVHSPKPSVISITQATERGTVYSADEIETLARLASREGMGLHMDGARFANAVAFLGCTPAEITWKAGVEVLSFGASKNGALCAEAVVFFDRAMALDFEYRRKRAGHLISKMRFVSAQLLAYLRNERWLEWARRANTLAQNLACELSASRDAQVAEPPEANEVFAYLTNARVKALRAAGVQFYDWEKAGDRTLCRFVLSSLTPNEDITKLVKLVQS